MGLWTAGEIRSAAPCSAACSAAGASGTGSRPQRTDPLRRQFPATQGRIRNYFGRESTVVYPPVNLDRFAPGPMGEH